MTPWDAGSHVCCMDGLHDGYARHTPNVWKRHCAQDDPQPFPGILVVLPDQKFSGLSTLRPFDKLKAPDAQGPALGTRAFCPPLWQKAAQSGACPLSLQCLEPVERSKRARDHPAGRSLWKPIRLGAALVVGLTLLFALPAGAYREIRVENGGSIAGRVIYDGPPHTAARLPVRKNRGFCGESVADERLLVGPNRGLRNVAVWLDGIDAGKPRETVPAVLDNVACAFVPRVQVVTVGQTLRLRNSDAILHNVHARRNGFTTIFNMGLPHWSEKTHRFTQPGRVVVDCDVLHTWMRAYVIVTAHPYAAVTGSDGGFRLTHVPAGAYTIRFWHEHLGERTRPVTVHPDRKTRIRLRYSPHGPPPHSSHLRPKRVSRRLFGPFASPTRPTRLP